MITEDKIAYMESYKRLFTEDDDTGRLQRALDYLNSKDGGILNLEKGKRYYLKRKNYKEGCFIKLYHDICLNGNEATFYLDNNSDFGGISGIFKCLDIRNAIYKDFLFDTSLVTIEDDNHFVDGFYLRYTGTGNINVHFNNIKFLGTKYQIPLNFSTYYESSETNFGYNVSLKNCKIFQTSYPTCINDLTYENVTWNVDLDVSRVSWYENVAQSPFKFTGKCGFCTGIQMNNCTVNINGSRNPITLFECMRSEVEINNLKVNNNSKVYITSNVMSSSSKDYGLSNKETLLTMNNCDMIEYSCYYGELARVVLNNCKLGNNNALYSIYNIHEKQSTLEKANGKIILNNCYFKDTSNRFYLDNGYSQIEMNNCIVEYDRSKAIRNGFNIGNNSNMIINNCIFIINGTGAAYLFNLNGAKQFIVDGITITRGTYSGETTEYMINCSSNIEFISIQNYFNPLRKLGTPIIRINPETTISNINI